VTQVIVQPAGNAGGREHYEDTVANPVEMARITPQLDETTRRDIETRFGDKSVAVWGVTSGGNGTNAAKWQKIQEGDIALFLQKGRAVAKGTVALKLRSAKLAKSLWGLDEDGETWEWIYFLDPVEKVDLSYDLLNEAAGYEAANRFQGFNVMASDKSAGVLRLLREDPSPSEKYFLITQMRQGSKYSEDIEGERYHFTGTVPGRLKLYNAGSARFVYYRPQRDGGDDAGSFFASGRITKVDRETRPDGDHFLASLADVETFARPVPRREFAPLSWNVQNAIAEISAADYHEILRRGSEAGVQDGQEVALSQMTTDATAALEAGGLLIDKADVTRYLAAILAKPFVILSGLSGSGKTKLAQAVAAWLGCSTAAGTLALVPVGADWTSTESVLGYADALTPGLYVGTDSLALLLHATRNPDLIHFLILDEMNLSHVERYFAEVLSAIESGEPITLYSGEPRGDVPNRITLPRNLVIVGTVNVDETTYMFSPKVLDRANVIEFRVRAERMQELVDGGRPIDLESIEGQGREYGPRLVAGIAARHALAPRHREQLKRELGLFYRVLEHFGLEFGYRVASEAAGFVSVHQELSGRGWSFDQAFDAQIVQKMLPKLNGSQRAIEPAIRALATLCLAEPTADAAREGVALEIAANKAALAGAEAPARYPTSRIKLLRMARTVSQNGFVSFAEA
jgi:hypothetical protein